LSQFGGTTEIMKEVIGRVIPRLPNPMMPTYLIAA